MDVTVKSTGALERSMRVELPIEPIEQQVTSRLESVVLPNPGLFGFLVSWGELLVGLALIVGLATRYASVAGAIMVAAFWFTKGQGMLEGQNHDVIWFVIFVVLAAVHAGRVHSVDAKLADRFRFLA